MKFIPTSIPGVLVIEPQVFKDSRGFFMESYRKSEFVQNGILADFIQDNHSASSKGVLRGLHFQISPMDQAKLVRVIKGEVFDVVVDIRRGSATFGKSFCLILTADKKEMLYIPSGFAHGFLTLSDGAEFIYKVSREYSPSHEKGIRWDDPDLGIPWPKLERPYIFSDKDKKFPTLKELKF